MAEQDGHWFTEPPPWYFPVRQSLGAALLAAERLYLRPIPYGIAVLKLMGRYLRGDYHRLVRRPGAARR